MSVRLGIVVPTHDRSAILHPVLEALGRQDIAPEHYEIVVVADGCRDGTARMVRALDLPCALRLIEQEAAGPAMARMRGAAAARGDILVFLDDDMIAVPGFARAHLEMHDADPGGVVLGCFTSVGTGHPGGMLVKHLELWWSDRMAALRDPAHRHDFRDFCTGNVSLGRGLFEAVGGFDVGFGQASGEDWALGAVLIAHGIRFRVAPAARTEHQFFPTLESARARAHASGLGDSRIAMRRPELHHAMDLWHMLDGGPRLRFEPGWRLHRWMWRHLPPVFHLCTRMGLRMGCHVVWRKSFGALAALMYWKGVEDAWGSLDRLRAAAEEVPLEPEPRHLLELELDDIGPDLDGRLAIGRPDAVGICDHGRPVAWIGPIAGGEPVRAVHVERALDHWRGCRVLRAMAPADVDPVETAALEPWPRQDGAAASREPSRRTTTASAFRPSLVIDLDLEQPFARRWGTDSYHELFVLLRRRGRPVGVARLPHEPRIACIEGAALARAIADRTAVPAAPAIETRGGGIDPHDISVVVCTRERPQSLARCLAALQRSSARPGEIVVVDNAPDDDATREVVRTTACRYVSEPRPGSGWARQRGLEEARGAIVAFVDDDALVDPHWLAQIAAAFDDPRTGIVTGLVLPIELETRAQALFECYGGMSKGFAPRLFDPAAMTPGALLAVHALGVGANSAFRCDALRAIGGFDVGLGGGTPASGAEDLDAFHRVLMAGWCARYEPSALVWHRHRRDMTNLARQIHANGRAFGVHLLKRCAEGAIPRAEIARFALHWARHWLLRRLLRGLVGRHPLPLGLLWAELRGALGSPWAFFVTRRRDRRDNLDAESARAADQSRKRATCSSSISTPRPGVSSRTKWPSTGSG